MPMYNLGCTAEGCGVISERYLRSSEVDHQVCEECGSPASYVPAFYYSDPRNAQTFDPVVIHRDTAGNVRFPGDKNAKMPPGYERVELTTLSQVRKFENEQNRKGETEAAKFHESKRFFREGQLKENRRVMDGLVQNFTPRGRKFHDAMRQASEAKNAQHKQVSPASYFEAFSMDASNREGFVSGERFARARK